MHFLKRHPFPVVAWFDRVVAISYAFPEAILRPFVPASLEIDSYEGFGFVTVAMVWTRRLRPAGFPEALGQDFLLAGYRVFTKFHEAGGRRLRGLKILRSETDKRTMVLFGNLLTRYHYRFVRVEVAEHGAKTHVRMQGPDGSVTLDLTFEEQEHDVPLPAGSPFPDWRTARRFAGPMPFTFSPEADGSVLVIEGKRESWEPHPVVMHNWRVAFFDEGPLRGVQPILANAFAVHDVDYRWERGHRAMPEMRQ